MKEKGTFLSAKELIGLRHVNLGKEKLGYLNHRLGYIRHSWRAQKGKAWEASTHSHTSPLHALNLHCKRKIHGSKACVSKAALQCGQCGCQEQQSSNSTILSLSLSAARAPPVRTHTRKAAPLLSWAAMFKVGAAHTANAQVFFVQLERKWHQSHW